MKVRHIPAVFRHDPLFVLRNGRRMLAHTFRGSSWRSAIGLEDARDVFRRYQGIRRREREYLEWPDPQPALSNAASTRDMRLESAPVALTGSRRDGSGGYTVRA
jgi:hypothetical protein